MKEAVLRVVEHHCDRLDALIIDEHVVFLPHYFNASLFIHRSDRCALCAEVSLAGEFSEASK